MAVERKFPGIVVHIKAYGNPEVLGMTTKAKQLHQESYLVDNPDGNSKLVMGHFTYSMIALKFFGYTTMLAYHPDSVYDLLAKTGSELQL
ncbi:hypothetical protein Tco_1327496 [Tanacetum coccineum]